MRGHLRTMLSTTAAPSTICTMSQHLLETKLHIPPWRASSVSRTHLVAALQAGLEAGSRLTLISAPPGYGKTTLAAEWIQTAAVDRRVVWLALDDADNQPVRFFGHWFAALARVGATVSEALPPLAAMSHLPPMWAARRQALPKSP